MTETASCFLHGTFDAKLRRCPACVARGNTFQAGEGSRPSLPVAPDGLKVSRCTCGRPITDPCWTCTDK